MGEGVVGVVGGDFRTAAAANARQKANPVCAAGDDRALFGRASSSKERTA